MSTPKHVQPLDKLKARLETLRATGQTWREIATKFDGVPAGTLCAIAKGREPHKASVRAALGLPVLVPVVACAACGEPHIRKTCPKSHKSGPARRRPTWRDVRAAFVAGALTVVTR